MAKPERRPKYISPRGAFSYPKLTEPDTKFKEEGEYSVTVIYDNPNDPEVQALIKLVDAAAAESLANAKANAKTPAEARRWETKYLPYGDVEDEETGEPTGQIKVKFSMKASGISKKTGKKWARKPALFDAKGSPITSDIKIGGGTIGKISYEIIPYSPTTQVGASVKLALEGVQIIDLKEWGQRDAKSYGFGEEEGFSADDYAGGSEFGNETEDPEDDDKDNEEPQDF